MQESSGYKVVASEVPSAHSRDVTIFYQAMEKFSVEAHRIYSVNVLRFQMASGQQRWFIVG